MGAAAPTLEPMEYPKGTAKRRHDHLDYCFFGVLHYSMITTTMTVLLCILSLVPAGRPARLSYQPPSLACSRRALALCTGAERTVTPGEPPSCPAGGDAKISLSKVGVETVQEGLAQVRFQRLTLSNGGKPVLARQMSKQRESRSVVEAVSAYSRRLSQRPRPREGRRVKPNASMVRDVTKEEPVAGSSRPRDLGRSLRPHTQKLCGRPDAAEALSQLHCHKADLITSGIAQSSVTS